MTDFLPHDAPSIPGVKLARLPRPQYAFYLVGDDGSIWTVWSGTWKKMKPIVKKSGYHKVNLAMAHNPAVKQEEYVHCLVALAFLGEPPPGKEVLHGNDQKWDNRLANLSYGTRRQNNLDQVRNRSIRGD